MNEVNTVERPVMWGCDDLREWLTSQGFTCWVDSLSRDNRCNWYAYKRSKYQARELALNEAKLVAKTTCHHESTEFANGFNMAALNIE